MTDPSTVPPGQAPPSTPVTPPATAPPPQEFDPERAMATIRAQREAERLLKQQLADAEARVQAAAAAEAELKAIKDAQLSAEQRAQQEREEQERRNAEAQAVAATAQQQLQRAHTLAGLAKPEHGLVDAEAALALISGVEYDDQGHPVNLTERVAALVEAKPYLKGAAAPPPPAPNINPGGGGNQPPPTLTAEEAEAAARYGKQPTEYEQWKGVTSIDDYERLMAARRAAQQ